jgi:hypothetical protein
VLVSDDRWEWWEWWVSDCIQGIDENLVWMELSVGLGWIWCWIGMNDCY